MVAVTGATEVTVHGWDISVAYGARRPVPPGLPAVLLPIARCSSPQAPGLACSPTRFGCPARPPSATQLVAFPGCQQRPAAATGPAAAKPGKPRRPVRGDSRESGWSISVGRQQAARNHENTAELE
jgi:hypothetical protein